MSRGDLLHLFYVQSKTEVYKIEKNELVGLFELMSAVSQQTETPNSQPKNPECLLFFSLFFFFFPTSYFMFSEKEREVYKTAENLEQHKVVVVPAAADLSASQQANRGTKHLTNPK